MAKPIPLMEDQPIWRRVANFAGLDQAVLFGLLARIWSMVSGFVALLLIALFFTPQIQGFYYTFLSLVALQVFAEMGLAQVLIQFAAHEWASLSLEPDGSIRGDAVAERRLSGLAHFSLRWFSTAALLFFAVIEVVGYYMFGDRGGTVAWVWPWTALCIVVCLDLCTLPFLSMLEGTNQVASAYLIRLARAVVSSLALWLSIALGGGLWSAAIGMGSGLLTCLLLILWRHRRFFSCLFGFPSHHAGRWWRELWPMQWRIALSWFSGYLSFALFTPVLFHFHGPVVAGQMGMSWNLAQAIGAVASLLVQTKAPTFGMLIARREWAALDRLALRVGLSTALLATVGALAMGVLAYLAGAMQLKLAARLLPLDAFCLFLLGMLAIQFTMPLSVYLRAHRREPLLGISLASGALIALSTMVLGYFFGPFGMGAGYAAVCVFFSLPLAIMILRRCRRDWHVD